MLKLKKNCSKASADFILNLLNQDKLEVSENVSLKHNYNLLYRVKNFTRGFTINV